jgi:NADH-ubiquinone oxidoreductase chain 5
MYLNLLFLPFCGCIFTGLFGRLIGFQGSSLISTSCCGFACLISLLIFFEVALHSSKCVVFLLPWVKVDFFEAEWGFIFDTLSVTLIVIVCFISFFVHLYSIEYLHSDPHLPRFICYLSLFTFFILILVSANNFLLIFLGWEGIGLSSYLLINFWFTRIQANKAGIKAIIVNRIGDFGLALGIIIIYINYDTIDYTTVFAITPALQNQSIFVGFDYFNTLNLIGLLLFIGACGKSAQLGLHTWLPDAIEGPTPVSALIHAATLVTGGVFLLVRCSPLLEYAPGTLSIIAIIGGITALFAGTVGLVQNDIKRVIAYSTCSQLGYIIFACGCSQYNTSIYHLANHAFFKALLFLGAGSLIHGLSDEQDIRKIGGLRKLIPFTYAIISIGSFSLIGIPFLTGFYSKDSILESAYATYSIIGHFAYYCGSFAAFFTGFYSLRLLYLCFLSKPNGSRPIIIKAHESTILITLPLAILAIPSIFCGYIIKDAFIGMGSPFWANSLYIHPNHINDSEFLPNIIKNFPLFLSISGGASALYFYHTKSKLLYQFKLSYIGRLIYTFLNRKWFFDKLYNTIFSQLLLKISYHITYKIIDRGIIEIYGPHGLSILFSIISKSLQNLSSKGNTYQLALVIFSSLVFIVYILIYLKIAIFFLLFSCFFFIDIKIE